jgi:hypothetical protein
MPRNSDTVKAANLRRAKSKAKVIEWESRVHSRGVRDVPVEVSTAASRPIPRKKACGEPRAESANELPHETAFQPMDVDETFWMEEPVMPGSGKKVRQPERLPQQISHTFQSKNAYIEDFIPKIGPYLRCLLDSEGVPAETTCQSCKSAPFEWRCSDCFPALVLCKECCRKSHQLLPFHRVQKWVGQYFTPSWLREVGVCLQFGHAGGPCPNQIVRHKAL